MPATGSSPVGAVSRGSFDYEVRVRRRSGKERIHRYATEDPLQPGQVLRLDGHFWLIEAVEAARTPPRATAKPARYRLLLRYPDGRIEAGAFRRYRFDAPRLGHSLSTIEDGLPVSWEVVDERLAHDEHGESFLELVAERDYGELEQLPDHELEHALASRAQRLPDAAASLLTHAQEAGLAIELVALEPGELPDWSEARRYIDDLILEEIEDDLVELCGVNPDRDPRESWLDTVRERLRADLANFRADLEGDHDEIEQWDLLDGRVFAAVG
ncbi:MAG: hypothetical protein ACXVFE_17185, partial [Gaiellaceae bacterium]